MLMFTYSVAIVHFEEFAKISAVYLDFHQKKKYVKAFTSKSRVELAGLRVGSICASE